MPLVVSVVAVVRLVHYIPNQTCKLIKQKIAFKICA